MENAGCIKKSYRPKTDSSGDVLAYVNLVNNELLDDRSAFSRRKSQYQLRKSTLCERHRRDPALTRKLAEADFGQALSYLDDPEVKLAENLANEIRRFQQFKTDREARQKQYEKADEMTDENSTTGPPRLNRRGAMTEEELSKEAELEGLRTINKALRKPDQSEKRVIGYLQKIDCKNGVVFNVKTDTEAFSLSSKDFAGLLQCFCSNGRRFDRRM